MTSENNLYESLYADSDENDYELERLNQMFNHLNFDEISQYFDINSYNNSFSVTDSGILSVVHVNLRSLRSNLNIMTANRNTLLFYTQYMLFRVPFYSFSNSLN